MVALLGEKREKRCARPHPRLALQEVTNTARSIGMQALQYLIYRNLCKIPAGK
jgi:hypothetical protein